MSRSEAKPLKSYAQRWQFSRLRPYQRVECYGRQLNYGAETWTLIPDPWTLVSPFPHPALPCGRSKRSPRRIHG